MKANTPERIWIDPATDLSKLSGHIDKNSVEYIRTDAFIEKALAYLHDKFYFNNVFYGIVSTDFNTMEEMSEDFRNYMKGE